MEDNPVDELLSRVSRFASILGISRTDLKIYSFLLLEGQMSARELSEKMGISYTKIYTILGKLEEKGWIRRIGKKPAFYEAIPLRDLWANVKKTIEVKINEFEKDFIEPLSSMLSTSSTYSITMIPPSKLKSTIFEILDSSNKIMIAVSFPEILETDILELIKVKSYNSDIKLILQNDMQINNLSGVNTRKLQSMFGSGIITSSAVLLIIKNADKLSGLFSNHKYIVDIASVYFNHLWEQAK
ncbi:TrmB family transcriptional regulator [Acidianus manzaensis]|uniref:TrmB family transcriptional regulator n=1 Tax=Acidianus manzaensis TaxID=282676 RepID=A0A1W6K3I5_9CREN|nr:helix-turn-helix domain-containing protein [Acidianus manzaensis]ARM77103.1 TrmB family transcriptional regulator [Acidianus manzaensis]